MPGAQTVRIPASRVYRMRPWQHIIGIVFLVFGLVFGIAVWSQVLTGQKEASFLEMMVPVLFTAVAVLILHRASQNYVQVSESALASSELAPTKLLLSVPRSLPLCPAATARLPSRSPFATIDLHMVRAANRRSCCRLSNIFDGCPR